MLQDQIKATACAGEMWLLYERVGKKINHEACLLQKSKPLKPSIMKKKSFFPNRALCHTFKNSSCVSTKQENKERRELKNEKSWISEAEILNSLAARIKAGLIIMTQVSCES